MLLTNFSVYCSENFVEIEKSCSIYTYDSKYRTFIEKKSNLLTNIIHSLFFKLKLDKFDRIYIVQLKFAINFQKKKLAMIFQVLNSI